MYKDYEKKRCALHMELRPTLCAHLRGSPASALEGACGGSTLHSDVVSGGRDDTTCSLFQLPRVCTEAFGVCLERVGFSTLKTHTKQNAVVSTLCVYCQLKLVYERHWGFVCCYRSVL